MVLVVDDLLGLAVKGYFGIFKKIHDMAVDELYSEDRIKEQLLDLQALYDAGEISEEAYARREVELLQRLTVARERR